jgi:predicted ATPase
MNSQTDKPFSENISFQEQNVKNECDALTSLNLKFLDLCKKYTNKTDFRMLSDNYRKCVENIGSTVVKETD